jgi:hypothetical protein
MVVRKRNWSKQEAVALHLAAGKAVKAAAEECGVGERTVHTWLEDPEFIRRVQQLQAEIFSRTVARLTALGDKTCEKLEQLLTSGNDAVALGACKTVLENGLKMRQAVDLEARLLELERKQAESEKRS